MEKINWLRLLRAIKDALIIMISIILFFIVLDIGVWINMFGSIILTVGYIILIGFLLTTLLFYISD